ncbi:MAG: MgtC/SapB family protein [Lachnospiraceae bacterium]|nr:MgtC/SapB family protein [Lachnospiraceae bacterium]
MLPVFDSFRDLTLASITLRLCLAVFCSGLVGIERAVKRRPAGFRTHILICIGAAMTTMTSQYLLLVQEYYTDIARLGAQVVAGISFIGAGTILVTRQHRIKGLTTAAGLWASAIVGLALGAGFFEGGLIVTALIILAEVFFSRLEFYLLDTAPELSLLIEYGNRNTLDQLLLLFQKESIKILDMQVTRSASSKKHNASVIFTLRLERKHNGAGEILKAISSTEGVMSVDEL